MARNKVTFFKDSKGKFRWQFTGNGKVMADSGEGYRDTWNAKRALERLVGVLKSGEFEVGEK